MPMILETGVQLLIQLASGIIQAIPQLVAQLPQIISAIVSGIGALMSSIVNTAEHCGGYLARYHSYGGLD